MPEKKRKYSRFDENEREHLSVLWNEFKLKRSEIARELGRTWIGLDNELKRGFTGELEKAERDIYDPKLAAEVYKENSRKRGKSISKSRTRNADSR